MKEPSESPNVAYTFSMFGNETFHRLFLENFEGFEAQMDHAGVAALSGNQAAASFSGFEEYPSEWRVKGQVASFFHPPMFLQIVAILKQPFSKELVAWSLGAF